MTSQSWGAYVDDPAEQPDVSMTTGSADTGGVVVSKRFAWFFVAFGVWSWIIWPVFLKNIWADHRSWNHGMTAFFGVHLVVTIVSLALGTTIGVYGIRALRARPPAASAAAHQDRRPAELSGAADS